MSGDVTSITCIVVDGRLVPADLYNEEKLAGLPLKRRDHLVDQWRMQIGNDDGNVGHYLRAFAQGMLACGSKVLYFLPVIFRPSGEK